MQSRVFSGIEVPVFTQGKEGFASTIIGSSGSGNFCKLGITYSETLLTFKTWAAMHVVKAND